MRTLCSTSSGTLQNYITKMWQLHQSPHLKRFIHHLLYKSIKRLKSTRVGDYNTIETLKRDFKIGTEVEGFIVRNVDEIPEFHMYAISLRHQATNADYLHVFRDDNNNVFSVGFRTTPTDSTGLPHILEHTILCGSKHYPCKHPFIKMMNRSLATYMNALTGPDFTMYPFSTQNLRDFNNLLSVYLDSVFNPRLRESDFKIEGWRLEHADLNNPDSDIVFKGVVYNEMKTSLSDPQTVFAHALLNNLLPTHSYRHTFGGDPNKIPLVTLEDLKLFHKKFYNPNNARFYSYGNFSLANHLYHINKNFLRDFDSEQFPNPGATAVPRETRWGAPRRKHISCRMDPLTVNPHKQSSVAIGVLLHDTRNILNGFHWSVLSDLLVAGPNSAFYKALIEPQIGTGYTPSTGYEFQTRDTYFSVGLQGVAPTDFSRVEEMFNRTIDNAIAKGFDEKDIEAILHGIELGMKHEISNFGLSTLFSIAPVWNHQGNVFDMLNVNKLLSNFRAKLKGNPKYLQDVLKNMVKGNRHKLILTMSPDDNYILRQREQENRMLEEKVDSLSEEDVLDLLREGRELRKQMETAHDVSSLPTLRIKDINKELQPLDIGGAVLKGVPVQMTEQPTNGLIYYRGIFNVSNLDKQYKELLPLFATAITRMGTTQSNYRELDQRISSKTGGISFIPHFKDNVHEMRTHEEGLLFTSYSLQRNMNDMFHIILEIIHDLKLEDVWRFETITRLSATNLANSLIERGHHYAILSAGSFVSNSIAHKDNFAGVTFIERIRGIAQQRDMSHVLESLKKIGPDILNKKHLRTAVNYSESASDMIVDSIESFVENLPGEMREPYMLTPLDEITHEHTAVHHILPIPVNFTSMAIQTVPYTHADFATLTVAARLLSAKYLHPLIRERGGAYGTGAFLSLSGTFFLYSYGDPNPMKTFETFDNAGKWGTLGKISREDLEEAILGVFQKIDAPVSPGQKGMESFVHGVSEALLQQHRLRVMNVSLHDIAKVSWFYLMDSNNVGRALIGPPNAPLVKKREHESWKINHIV